MGRELRHAARRLVRTPIFTAAAVLTIALAIGANVAIFAVAHRVVLSPLPYGDSAALVTLDHGFPSRNIPAGVPLTIELYYEYLDRARTLDGIAVYRTDEVTMTGRGGPERVRSARATPSLASVLRVAPVQGRWFNEQEGAAGVPAVAVLSYGLWKRRYGGDPNILGTTVTLEGVATAVVGVMPAAFAFPDPRVEIWVPAVLSRTSRNNAYDFTGIARLHGGATVAAVRRELTQLAVALESRVPGNGYERLASTATPLIDATVGPFARTLWILLASVALVLLIAWANVANLLLVRADTKQREIAVRRALGAGRSGVAGYFAAESAWLSAVGGTLAIALAWGGVRLLVAAGPSTLPRLHEVHLDGTAIAFGAALTVVSALALAAIPLLRISSLSVSLHESGRGNTTSRGRHRARQVLMAGQVALALVLLVSSGLMLRSFQQLRRVDPGFDAREALTFRVGLPSAKYADRERMVAAHRAALDKLSAIPAVSAVAASSCLPLSEQGCMVGPLFVEGRALPPGTNAPLVRSAVVTGGFFETMGTPIVRGRGIEPRDLDHGEPVAVINQAFANLIFPGADPIGRRVVVGGPAFFKTTVWLTVIGVVANTSLRALAEPTRSPIIYVPMIAARAGNVVPSIAAMSYVLRTAVPPTRLTDTARRRIADVDADLAIAQVLTLEEILDRAAAQMAFTMALIVIAAAVALALGVIGIYGAMSYIVGQRTAEIGVRLALGARPNRVAAMIVRQGGSVTLSGIALGLAVAFAGSRLIASLLFGISPRDPAVFGATTLGLLAVALLACWLPARRAARLSPLEALRTD